jgi:hypothetical protein
MLGTGIAPTRYALHPIAMEDGTIRLGNVLRVEFVLFLGGLGGSRES